jgi:hypothetical protein
MVLCEPSGAKWGKVGPRGVKWEKKKTKTKTNTKDKEDQN